MNRFLRHWHSVRSRRDCDTSLFDDNHEFIWWQLLTHICYCFYVFTYLPVTSLLHWILLDKYRYYCSVVYRYSDVTVYLQLKLYNSFWYSRPKKRNLISLSDIRCCEQYNILETAFSSLPDHNELCELIVSMRGYKFHQYLHCKYWFKVDSRLEICCV